MNGIYEVAGSKLFNGYQWLLPIIQVCIAVQISYTLSC